MLDISQKSNTLRTATAKAILRVSPSTITTIKEHKVPKGDPLAIAKVAAVQAAKCTSNIIPYCHPLPITHVGVEFQLDEDAIEITTFVKAIYKTGVEMEALTAATVAALTIYDMTKMLDELMCLEQVRLVAKTGGKSSYRPKSMDRVFRAAVLVMSDSISAGKAEDVSGQLILDKLKSEGFEVVDHIVIIPDDETQVVSNIRRYTDDMKVDMLITSGGTGLGPRDITPETVQRLMDKPLPGVSEAIRVYGQDRNLYSMLSRATAGVRNNTLVVTLPGSPGGVRDALEAIFPAIHHAFKMMAGEGHSKKGKEHAAHSSEGKPRK